MLVAKGIMSNVDLGIKIWLRSICLRLPQNHANHQPLTVQLAGAARFLTLARPSGRARAPLQSRRSNNDHHRSFCIPFAGLHWLDLES